MNKIKDKKVINAILLGTLCSVSYLAVYFARNILGAVTPKLIENGIYTAEYIGKISSAYFIFYGIGQLINGVLGEKIKARNMICGGLFFAAIANFLFSKAYNNPTSAVYLYGLMGVFLAMIYAPMTKVVAENTEPTYAVRCSLGYTFASFFGSPLAGLVAAFLMWQNVFLASSVALIVMAIVCFVCFLNFEKRGIVKYNVYQVPKEKGAGIKVLIKNDITRFAIMAMLTGVVRTSVIFWLPTYISQYLGFNAENSALIFTVATLAISTQTFIVVFVYEKLGKNMYKTISLMFILATLLFLSVYFVKMPILNIILMTLAIMASNGADTMMWSRYCPGLRDTGMTSSATGFLDFISYLSAAVSSVIFANAAQGLGWQNLILVWMALMFVGMIIFFPYNNKKVW